jgi:hypothetical protein
MAPNRPAVERAGELILTAPVPHLDSPHRAGVTLGADPKEVWLVLVPFGRLVPVQSDPIGLAALARPPAALGRTRRYPPGVQRRSGDRVGAG